MAISNTEPIIQNQEPIMIQTLFDPSTIYKKIDRLNILESNIGNKITLDSVLKSYNIPLTKEDFNSALLLDPVEQELFKNKLINILGKNKFLFYFNSVDTDEKLISFEEYKNVALATMEAKNNNITSSDFNLNDIIMFFNKSNKQIEDFNKFAQIVNNSLDTILSDNILNINFNAIYEGFKERYGNDASNEVVDILGKLSQLATCTLNKNMTIEELNNINHTIKDLLQSNIITEDPWVNDRFSKISINTQLIYENSQKLFDYFNNFKLDNLKNMTLNDLSKINKFALKHSENYMAAYNESSANLARTMTPYSLDIACNKLLKYIDAIKVSKIKLDSDRSAYSEKQKEIQKALSEYQEAQRDPHHVKMQQSLQKLEHSINSLQGLHVSNAASDPALKVTFTFIDVFADLIAELIKLTLKGGKKGIDMIESREIRKIEKKLQEGKSLLNKKLEEIKILDKNLFNLIEKHSDLAVKDDIVSKIEDRIKNFKRPLSESTKSKLKTILILNTVKNMKTDLVLDPKIKAAFKEMNILEKSLFNDVRINLNSLINLSESNLMDFLDKLDSVKGLHLDKESLVKFLYDNVSKDDNGILISAFDNTLTQLETLINSKKTMEIKPENPTLKSLDTNNEPKLEMKPN